MSLFDGAESLNEKWLLWQFGRAQQDLFVNSYISFKSSQSHAMKDREVIGGLQESFESTYGNDSPIAFVTKRILDQIASGASLAKAMEPYFEESVMQVFTAVYNSTGDFGKVRELIERIDKAKKLMRSFWRALFFPFFIFIIGMIIFVFVGLFYMPIVEAMIKEDQLDWFMIFVRGGGAFMETYWPVIAIAVIGLAVSYKLTVRTWTGEYRKMADKYFPPYQIATLMLSFNLFGVLSLLSSSGSKVKDCLEIMLPNASDYSRWHLEQMLDMTSSGVYGLLQLETGLLPPRLKLRLRIASKSGVSDQAKIFHIIAHESFEDFEASMEKPRVAIGSFFLVLGVFLLGGGLYTMLSIQMIITGTGGI
ncbi:type II secretion system F family protein (plasmid) [Aeromonas hydrophila]|uniref:type II secretion system F family protein n=1 Tax=Aeromonas hydrophila TaxID=644 RepID=UPI002ED49950|nr:type II secretion system F family protein [Aeromonas hydrophila]